MKDARDPGTVDAFSQYSRANVKQSMRLFWQRHPQSKPGPKPTGKAKSNAELQAAYRDRQRRYLRELEASAYKA